MNGLGKPQDRELWATRVGLILAMAGNAIGLGNFLRFPVKAAQNGGGAFMIPYFVALLLLGIPLMWVEWCIGRRGGQFGYGSAVGAFGTLIRSLRGARIANILGVMGISIPLAFAIYYTYIESWTLAYSFFSASGRYSGLLQFDAMRNFLGAFQGKVANEYFSGLLSAMIFFLVTIGLNVYILSRGISGGIERLAKIALPMLFVFAVILIVRVWTLPTPDLTRPENTVFNGFAWLWNPSYCLGLLLFWGIQNGIPIISMSGRNSADTLYLWGARAMMAALTIIAVCLVVYAYRKGTLHDFIHTESSTIRDDS